MKKEQEQLLDKASESLEAAKILFKDEYYGFCVSRTYYAMFYVAQAFLLELNLTFSKHSAVIAGFGKEFVSTGKIDNKFHRYLIDAQSIRNIGDYDTVSEISKEEAQIEIERANEFIKFAKELLK